MKRGLWAGVARLQMWGERAGKHIEIFHVMAWTFYYTDGATYKILGQLKNGQLTVLSGTQETSNICFFITIAINFQAAGLPDQFRFRVADKRLDKAWDR